MRLFSAHLPSSPPFAKWCCRGPPRETNTQIPGRFLPLNIIHSRCFAHFSTAVRLHTAIFPCHIPRPSRCSPIKRFENPRAPLPPYAYGTRRLAVVPLLNHHPVRRYPGCFSFVQFPAPVASFPRQLFPPNRLQRADRQKFLTSFNSHPHQKSESFRIDLLHTSFPPPLVLCVPLKCKPRFRRIPASPLVRKSPHRFLMPIHKFLCVCLLPNTRLTFHTAHRFREGAVPGSLTFVRGAPRLRFRRSGPYFT